MKSIALLGRQPAIGLAELESLYGSAAIQPVGSVGALLNIDVNDVDFKRLGGCMKLGKVLTTIDTARWEDIEKHLANILPNFANELPEGKLTVGISTYGFNLRPQKINVAALTIKKQLKRTGRPIRMVPNKSTELSSAQVLHNKLFTSHNWELLLIRHKKRTILAQTTNVQDIEAYAARDQARPKRDARVGMLPPKLAQILVNLCNPVEDAVVLDPFCGTGVVLQETFIMGRTPYGTDLEPRMIEYTKINLEWLTGKVFENAYVGDATNFEWKPFDTIACETYLGRPFTNQPDRETLRNVMQDVDTIHQKFLKNVASQTKPGFKMCIAVPAWRMGNSFLHLKTLDSLEELGYTRESFVLANNNDLIYYRDGQVVGRELVVLKRI